MSYDLHITQAANHDIDSAADYIEFKLLNPIAADALLEDVHQWIPEVLPFPYQFPLLNDPLLSTWGIRYVSVNNYLAFYVIDDAAEVVHMIRFLHSRQDWAAILKQGFSLS